MDSENLPNGNDLDIERTSAAMSRFASWGNRPLAVTRHSDVDIAVTALASLRPHV